MVDNTTILSVIHIHNSKFFQDSDFTLDPLIQAMSQSCHFFPCNISKVQPFLSVQATKVLVQTFFLLYLDYCNILLVLMPPALLTVTLIQNVASRLIFLVSRSDPLAHFCVHLWLPFLQTLGSCPYCCPSISPTPPLLLNFLSRFIPAFALPVIPVLIVWTSLFPTLSHRLSSRHVKGSPSKLLKPCPLRVLCRIPP